MELLNVCATGLVGGDDIDLHDMDGTSTSAMASTHVTVCTINQMSGTELQQEVTAAAADSSRYSRYILCVPERES